MINLKIISGALKSRIIYSPPLLMKPTSNRVRETLFNWLMPYTNNSICLDVFAGSGILGLESISRGSRYCKFIEINKVLIHFLKKNSNNLLIKNLDILKFNGILYLKRCRNYNIIFLDPPFFSNLLFYALINIYNNNNIGCNSIIYIEYFKFHNIESVLKNFRIIKKSIYGNVCFALIQKVII